MLCHNFFLPFPKLKIGQVLEPPCTFVVPFQLWNGRFEHWKGRFNFGMGVATLELLKILALKPVRPCTSNI